MVGATGLVHPAETPANPEDCGRGGAESGAVTPDSAPAGAAEASSALPPDVAELARRLAALPEAVRAEIMATLKTSGGKAPDMPGGRHHA